MPRKRETYPDQGTIIIVTARPRDRRRGRIEQNEPRLDKPASMQ